MEEETSTLSLRTLIEGALLVTLSLTVVVFLFQAQSVTVIVKVHDSLNVVHDVIALPLNDNVTLQISETSSIHEAIKSFHIYNWFQLIRNCFHQVISSSR